MLAWQDAASAIPELEQRHTPVTCMIPAHQNRSTTHMHRLWSTACSDLCAASNKSPVRCFRANPDMLWGQKSNTCTFQQQR